MFTLAHELKRTVYELEDEMPPDEFSEWGGYFAWKNEQEKKAIERAKPGARSKRKR